MSTGRTMQAALLATSLVAYHFSWSELREASEQIQTAAKLARDVVRDEAADPRTRTAAKRLLGLLSALAVAAGVELAP